MSGIYQSPGSMEEDQKPSKPSPLDYLSRLASVLSLIVVILELTGKRTPFLWALLVVIVVVVVVGFYSPGKEAARRWAARTKDKRALQTALPKFRNFVRQFGEFVSRERSDTLHYMLEEAGRAPGQNVAVPAIRDVELWYNLWNNFAQRIERQRLDLPEFLYGLREFYDLVGLYDTRCVVPVFNDARPEFRAGLTDGAKSNLNSFQQRFMNFLTSFENFLKELVESRPIFQDLPRHFSHPKPL
jgi:hypothetical protein